MLYEVITRRQGRERREAAFRDAEAREREAQAEAKATQIRITSYNVCYTKLLRVDKDGKLLPWDADVTRYAGHPRTASSYSTTLQLARENGVPLMFTLAQLSYWTAKHLGDTGLKAMKERGRVQVGKVADLTLFNPKTVKRNNFV